jgi:hypothetical protein
VLLPATPVPEAAPSPLKSIFTRWLCDIGVTELLAEQLVPLLNAESDAIGLTFGAVRERLRVGLDRFAGTIAHRATADAAAGRPVPWQRPSTARRGSIARASSAGSGLVGAEGARMDAIAAALRAQAEAEASGGHPMTGANSLFSRGGLHPLYWGVSRAQLATFIEEVRAAQHAGVICNPSREEAGSRYYPQSKFDDPAVGPNMHLVNKLLVKPLTASCPPLPGMSYALMKNLRRGGLRCSLFFSHAWDEGIYEFAKNALAAWPEGCEGAYLCCLSNPQNLDISALLGGDAKNSPFWRVLSEQPDALVMLANRNTPIHSRLWCPAASPAPVHLPPPTQPPSPRQVRAGGVHGQAASPCADLHCRRGDAAAHRYARR